MALGRGNIMDKSKKVEMLEGYMDEMDEDDMLALEYEAEYDERNNNEDDRKPLSKEEAMTLLKKEKAFRKKLKRLS